jgi:hypothetical protein
MVAPHHDYYGKIVLPSGQELHRSSSLNVFRVFRDRETGLPYTISCHEFTFHLAAPNDPEEAWRLELCYPSDERLREVMAGMSPLHPQGEDIGFPVHATQTPPPMIPMIERLRLNQVRRISSPWYLHAYLKQHSPDGGAPAEQVVGPEVATVDPRWILSPSMRTLSPEALQSMDDHEMGRQQQALDMEIRQRALKGLEISDDPFSSDTDSLPDLVPLYPELASTHASNASNSSEAREVCAKCFELHHPSAQDCPLFGSRVPVRNIAFTDAGEPIPGVLSIAYTRFGSFTDDVTDSPEQADELRRVLDVALGPTLNEWISYAPRQSSAELAAAARDARQIFAEFTREFDQEGTHERSETEDLEHEAIAALRDLATKTSKEIDTATDPVLPITQPIPVYAPTPTFNPQHGKIITRDVWSSSSASESASSSDITSYDGSEPYSPNFHRLETLSTGNWSPAVSDWSVDDWGFLFNPQWLIDDAISRLLTQSGHSSAVPPLSLSVSSRESTSIPSTPANSADPYHATQHSPQPAFLDTRETSSAELQETLYYWVYEGGLHQQDHLRFEDEMGTEPGHQALRALHGPLNSFVDYTTMSIQGPQDLQHPSHLPFVLGRLPIASNDAPDATSSATSLDHSLPTSDMRTTLASVPEEAEEEEDHVYIVTIDTSQQSARMDLLHPGPSSNKRKAPDGEHEPPYQNGRRKKLRKFTGDLLRHTTIEREAYKATGLTDARVIRMMAGVRLASIETAHRIEDMVWHRYGITPVRLPLLMFFRAGTKPVVWGDTQESFPARIIHHPFLFDVEVAKMQTLWHVLRRHNRTQLADLLHNLLTIRLRDEYAVSRLLTAGFLDDHYPELVSNYWELLADSGVHDMAPPNRGTSEGFAEFTDETPPEYSPNNSNEMGPSYDNRFRDAGVGQYHVQCNAVPFSGPDPV